jgi:bifunctional DNase/RNase
MTRNHSGPIAAFIVALLVTVLASCSNKESGQVEVEVRSVGLDQTSRSPVVLLQDKAKQVALPIWIGPAEAQAIAMQMEGVSPPRPLTHDLMKGALEQSGVEFEKVVIDDLRESTYYARIFLRNGSKKVELDSRPSDAIALAVRFQKPIFVARTLLQSETTIDLREASLSDATATLAGITIQELTDELARHFGLPPGRGVLVSNVTRQAGADLQRGDIIVAIDGERVTGVAALHAKIVALVPGAHADLAVQRGLDEIHVDFTASQP